ncbi:MAG TPA: hypothetical protein VFG63_11265 [Nocardioidaceae bacterium]|nr:hypothetical protein [Nocardioidaceae bacterium]
MSRRVSLPAADDLFRPTVVPDGQDEEAAAVADGDDRGPGPAETETETAEARPRPRTPSGRVRHDEKMTVYVTADELLDLEHTRLMLRRSHGLAVDRGRLVRAAIAAALADIEAHGDESAIVRRLTQS